MREFESRARRRRTNMVRVIVLFVATLFIQTAHAADPSEAELLAALTRLGIPLPQEVMNRPQIAPKVDQLRREPCDQAAILELAKELDAAGFRREAAKSLENFANLCGVVDANLRVAANIYLRLTDYAKVIDVANRIIAQQPYSDHGYFLRALAYDGLKNYHSAIADYLTSIELFGNKERIFSNAYFKLSDAYVALGLFCDAMRPVEQWVALNPTKNETSQTRAMLTDLSLRGRCIEENSGSEETIAITGPGKLIFITALVNGVRGRFILDTGATFVSLRRSFAVAAKVPIQDENAVGLHTAAGYGRAVLGRADSVKLGKIEAKSVAVVVQADRDGLYGGGADGLLGMSFLSRFDVRIDVRSVRIRPRTELR